MLIIFLGPPGSGKGTQAAILSKFLSIPSLSTSAILNDVIKNGGSLAEELGNYMSSGRLVPSALVNEMVVTTISKNEYKDGCILDGYPRNIEQAEFLDMKFPEASIKVLYFDISYEELVRRIEGRFTCSSCGAIYNKFSFNTKIDGVCDICESKDFKVRDDDNLEILHKRWEVYLDETKPLLDYYKGKGLLFSVDAAMQKEEITSSLKKLVGK